MIGTSLNQYRVTASLGAGGMGEVFRARDTRLNREVAIKILPKEFARDADRLRRFEQETKNLASINHPNILTIHDAGVQDGAPYLVSELLEGKTLREELSSGALPLRKATDYALQIAHGLAAAHGKSVIHRDLKPENIFVTKDGRLKILDFGLAKLQENQKSEIRNQKFPAAPDPEARTLMESTEPGKVMGTPAYMSPEQVLGEPVDHRTDIFSFGCVLYEMLSGTRAFKRDTPVESMHAVLKEEPPALAEQDGSFPPALERIVRRCLQKQPENRFQSVKDLAFALSEITSDQAPPGNLWRPSGRLAARAMRKSALLLVTIAVLAALACWLFWHRAGSSANLGTLSNSKQAVLDPSRQTLIRALEVATKGHDASLDEMKLAISLCQSVIDRNPADAEAWALMARLNCNLYDNFDRTPERLNAAQGAARNALSLAPTSVAARLAQASVYGLQRATFSQSLDMLRRLEQEAPKDPDVLVTLGRLLPHDEQTPDWGELIKLLDRALALRPNDPVALNDKAWALTFMGKADEADKLWDGCILRTGSPGAMTAKFYDLAFNREKTEQAKALLERFPPDLVFNDTAVRLVAGFWLFQREPAKGLAFLEPFPREFIADHFDEIPKGYLVGKLHAQAGQLAAAQVEWRKALDAVNKKLVSEPGAPRLISYKARLHYLLGEKDEAARQAEIFEQLTGPPRNRTECFEKLAIAMELGRTKEALSLIRGDLREYASPADMGRLLRRREASFPAVGSTLEFKAELASVQAEVARSENNQSAGSPGGTSKSSSTNSVAVLPFVNFSPDKADEYLSDGMTEELLNALVKAKDLRVPGRSSSFAFKGKTGADLYHQVGDQLHVSAVLEGSVRKAGDKLRVTAKLVNVANGFSLWSEEYDRDMTNIFAVQSDIAARVAEALKVRLLGAAAQPKKPTQSIEAYELYLQGRLLWNRRTEASFTQAIDYFNRAIALDPGYALAYAGLADCYAILSDYGGVPPRETVPKARAAALKAIELDGTLGEPHAALGDTESCFDWDWSGAEAEFRRAIDLNPTYATTHHWFGIALDAQNRLGEAVTEFQLAQDLDPLSPINTQSLADALFRIGKEELAIQILQKQIALDPGYAGTHEQLGICLIWQGKPSEAILELEKAHELYGNAAGWGDCGFAYARSGRASDAQQVLDQLFQLQQGGENVMMEIALVCHGLGDDTRALDYLEKAAEARATGLLYLACSPFWKDLRPHPRAQAILRKMHLVK